MKQQCLESRQAEFIDTAVAKMRQAQTSTTDSSKIARIQKTLNFANTNPSEFIIRFKGPLAIYHSGLGGTWSW
jgi:hypothetical protein